MGVLQKEVIKRIELDDKKLDLSELNLKKLPLEIFELVDLESLDISFNNLEEIPEEIGKLIKLKRLIINRNSKFFEITNTENLKYFQPDEFKEYFNSLNFNKINKLPNSIKNLQNLEELRISKTGLKSILVEIFELTKLKILEISNAFYNVSFLPIGEEIQKLKNLEVLNLSNNFLTKIPESLGEMTNLKELILAKNRLKVLPESFSNLINLKKLDLSKNKWNTLPIDFSQFKQLEELYLSSCKIKNVSNNLQNLENIKILDLSFNDLDTLPELPKKIEVLNLSNNAFKNFPVNILSLGLKKLDLSYNQLTDLPERFFLFRQQLQQLNLSKNNLSSFPQVIKDFKNLEQLNLSENNINNLQLDEEILELKKFKSFYIANNPIQSLPGELFQLCSLKSLDLSGIKLQELPEDFLKLTNLEVLDLSKNKLKELPKNFLKLDKLKLLNISSNEFENLSESISKCSTLQILFASKNKLKCISGKFINLKNLKLLHLENNMLGNDCVEMIERRFTDAQNVLECFQKNYYANKILLNEVKLVVIGNANVGKTSLINRLINKNKFDINEVTEGIYIHDWSVTIENQKIRVNIWDFGGQEILYTMHKCFLTENTLYLLLYDMSQDNITQTYIESWLDTIKSKSSDSPVIIVGNKRDRYHDTDLFSKEELMKKYNVIQGFHEVSCKENLGIENLKESIKFTIKDYYNISRDFNGLWMKIRYILKETYDEYITYEQYEEICKKNNIIDSKDQKALVAFLHDIGAILNFNILKKHYILNPWFITNKIYKILHHGSIKNNKGKITRKDYQKILTNDIQVFSPDIWDFLLKLMQDFELCFIYEDEDILLFPKKFSKESKEAEEWKTKRFRYEYEYDNIAINIIIKFIVHAYKYIDNDNFWKSGAILHQDKIRAKVEVKTRNIFVYTKGDNNLKERNLLIIISDIFEKIHSAKIKVQIHKYIFFDSDDTKHLVNLLSQCEALSTLEKIDNVIKGIACLKENISHRRDLTIKEYLTVIINVCLEVEDCKKILPEFIDHVDYFEENSLAIQEVKKFIDNIDLKNKENVYYSKK